MPFGDDDGYGTKVLGLAWHPDQDYFGCALNLEPSPVFTKRGILSLVVRIFDPVGLFGPVVFLEKAIMQRTWRHGLVWDDPLPDDIHADWSALVSELPSLLNVRVPRHINGRQDAPCYLLGFWYLTTLQSRPKWTEGVPNLSIDGYGRRDRQPESTVIVAPRSCDRVIARVRLSRSCSSSSHACWCHEAPCGQIGKVTDQCSIVAHLSTVPPPGFPVTPGAFDAPHHYLAIYVSVCVVGWRWSGVHNMFLELLIFLYYI